VSPCVGLWPNAVPDWSRDDGGGPLFTFVRWPPIDGFKNADPCRAVTALCSNALGDTFLPLVEEVSASVNDPPRLIMAIHSFGA
jgi:hypothetical protein